MSEWQAKRFWKEVCVDEQEDGFGILLDARPVKTPAKRALHDVPLPIRTPIMKAMILSSPNGSTPGFMRS